MRPFNRFAPSKNHGRPLMRTWSPNSTTLWLNFTNSVQATHDHDDQPVFDIELVLDCVDAELVVFHQQPDDLVDTHTSVDFNDDPSLTRSPIVRRRSSSLTRWSSLVPTSRPLQPTSTCPSRVHRNACISLFTPGRRSSPRHYRSLRGSRLLGSWT
jgi:hypothetical protein